MTGVQGAGAVCRPNLLPEAQDDFNRADNASLGANWVESGSNNFSISTNRLAHSAAGTSFAMWAAQLSSDDHYVQYTSLNTGQRLTFPILRANASSSATELYQAGYDQGSTQYRIHRYTGSFTLLAQSANGAGPQSGDIVRSQIVGSVITIKVNGSTVLSFDDSAFGAGFAGNRWVGFRGIGTSTLDDFQASAA